MSLKFISELLINVLITTWFFNVVANQIIFPIYSSCNIMKQTIHLKKIQIKKETNTLVIGTKIGLYIQLNIQGFTFSKQHSIKKSNKR